jgi:diamine N-acetyltransferase
MTEPSIRAALPADAAALAALAADTFRDAFAADNTAEDLALHLATHYGEAQQRREIGDPNVTTLVAEATGVLIGFCQLRAQTPPPCIDGRGMDLATLLEVQRFYVRSGWHGKGVAQKLMQTALAAATERGARNVWLGVFHRNLRAQAFYGKFGFVAVGEHTFTVGTDPQRDVIMLAPVPAPAHGAHRIRSA